MANLWFLLTLAVFCGCCACISAQVQTCPPYPSSCQDAYDMAKCANKTPTDGMYKIAYTSNGNRVYCDMTTPYCGPHKGWMKIGMKYPGSKCPPGLDEGMYGSKRLCGNRASGCKSTVFNTFGVPYTQVCGFVAGYQYKTPDAFRGVIRSDSIDEAYLDGVSITHGTPRKHIWSLAAGTASGTSLLSDCPCNVDANGRVPAFVKNNWYCESGNPTRDVLNQFFPNDVLWDGKNCTLREPPCCTSPWLPYFRTDVEGVSTDPIELRICHDDNFAREDVPIESYQFFVR